MFDLHMGMGVEMKLLIVTLNPIQKPDRVAIDP